MALLNSLFTWIMKKRIHQIELFMKYPHDVQEEWFQSLISTAEATEWGKKYDYTSILTPEEYKNRVPIQDYEDVKVYVDRMIKGEQNLIWPSDIKWFAKSSGTTSDRSKFIPVSLEALEDCHYQGGKDMLSIYCHNRPENKVFTGKSVVIGGSSQINNFSPDSYYGDLSSILIRNLPFWAEFKRTPNLEVTLNPNFEEKIEQIAQITIKENVTSLAGVPTWNLVMAKRILEITGKDNLLEVWPNLEFYGHGGVSFKPYREQFEKLIPSADMYYLENYNASEGYFGLQDRSDSEDLLLMLDYGIYYEFLPMEHIDEEHPKTLDLSEVEIGKNYALIISTNAGLWRYKIGDTIKFTSLSPYRFQISGRTKHYINTFGEEVIVDNAEKALSEACKATGAVIKDYTAGPIYFNDGKAGAHEWIIEFENQPSDLQQFSEVLDKTLREINSDYDAKRYKDMALGFPIIHNAAPDTFYIWMKSRGKLGGQNKVPRLANNREHIEPILELMGTR
ncbi:GH3 auxin-responsive promoter family protein [Sphingobacterium psychroaquaticum]|uniref:GH3 auxin-responsive promoter n=1 Tax=Sphingobacterium psychroaquaticum TaxID=561061 RepID=A0A1X7L6I0_9SPHI|nr:GH3 auxin-responsive promoter family protein [Sphingobacterium psychroaquaticum]QBQ42316.1 GH3 auxin-responsive promoter family protein [Sphingobacterium psychroaquaticum]SMG49197.1 GH3 auxin-responsive promoter [Sphingobacterium psychroaquaticum]